MITYSTGLDPPVTYPQNAQPMKFGPPRGGRISSRPHRGRAPDSQHSYHTPTGPGYRPRPQNHPHDPAMDHTRRIYEAPQPASPYRTADIPHSSYSGPAPHTRWGPARPHTSSHPNSPRVSASRMSNADSNSSTHRDRGGVPARAGSDRNLTSTPSEHWEDGYDQSEESRSPPAPARLLPSANNPTPQVPAVGNKDLPLHNSNPWAE